MMGIQGSTESCSLRHQGHNAQPTFHFLSPSPRGSALAPYLNPSRISKSMCQPKMVDTIFQYTVELFCFASTAPYPLGAVTKWM